MAKYKKNLINYILLVPLIVFWHYIFINIENVGEFGAGLPILILFFCLSSLIVFFKYLRTGFNIKKEIILFFILILWISIRFIADFQGVDALKQHTVATTGGMLLFYIIGLLIREVLNVQSIDHGIRFIFYGLIYLAYAIWIYIQFSNRIGIDLFLLDNLDGTYQRPGNFMSMSFVIFSFIYVSANINFQSTIRKSIYFIGSTCIYLSCAGLLLLESQLIGSNSATLIVLSLTLISLSMCLMLLNKKIYIMYIKKTGSIFEFRNIFFTAVSKFVAGIFFIVVCLIFVIIYIDLDITKLRAFGFGTGEISSLNSRFEILGQWGLAQLNYAPILGNVNVAYLVTGDAGLTLHNFLPDVQASLGSIGTIIVLILFFLLFRSLYRLATKKYNKASIDDFRKSSIAFYSIFIILFILLFANISSGFSWPVIWFMVGFFSNSLSFPSRVARIN